MAKIIFLSVILVFLGMGLSVLAEETGGIASETVLEDVTAQDLGTEDPKILPDSPFYFLKNLGRNVQSFFTFDPLAKTKLQEKFSNEHLVELKKMVEKNKSPEKIEKAVQKYQQSIEKVKTNAEKIKDGAEQNAEVGKFLDKFARQQILHQRILEKLQSQVPTTTFEKIQAAREEHLEKFGEVMNKLEQNKEKIQNRLERNLEQKSTSTQKSVIQIRDRILEKVRPGTTAEVKKRPSLCITLWDPVCGENGKTYSNACFAQAAGVKIARRGACDK